MALTANSLVKATGAGAIADTDLSGAVTTSGTSVTTLATGLSPDFASISLGAQKIQCFTVQIVNTAGTLQHRICVGPNDTGVLPTFSDKITGASVSLANTPTVSGVVDFTNGVGITANRIVLNTAAQVVASFVCFGTSTYYDGNVVRPRARPEFTSRDVNGTTRIRLEFVINNDLDGTSWTINTTNLTSGKIITVGFLGFLA